MPYLTEQMLVTLGKAGIKTLDDLADLATDELVQKKRPEQRRQRESNRPEDKGGILAEYGLSDEQGNEIIMAARAHWFEDERPRRGPRTKGRTRLRKPNGGRESCEPRRTHRRLPWGPKRGARIEKQLDPGSPGNGNAHVPSDGASSAANAARGRADPPRARLPTARSRPTSAPGARSRRLDRRRPRPSSSRARQGQAQGALPARVQDRRGPDPADLGERIEAALRQAALDRLGLEARAGTLITGAEKIESRLRARARCTCSSTPPMPASDGRASSTRPGGWAAALRRPGTGAQGLIFRPRATILSLALGRQNVVHIALTDRAAAARVRHALDRWRAFIGPRLG
jgi:hypothetical protein